MIKQRVHFDAAFPWRNEAPGKSVRQSLMVVASRLNSLDLKRNLCLDAQGRHKSRIS